MRLELSLYVIICFFMLPCSALYANNILVVDSYNADYPWSAMEREGFNRRIGNAHNVSYLSMDTKRIPQEQFAQQAEQIWRKIVNQRPDVVVTMDDNALKYLGQRIVDAGFYLVFMGVNNDPRVYFRDNQIPPGVGGVLERPLVRHNVAIISMLLPMKNNRVLLLLDNGTSSTGFIDHTLNGKTQIDIGDNMLEVVSIGRFDQWKKKVNAISANDYDAIIVGNYATVKDANGKQVTDHMLAEWTGKHSVIPVFSFWQPATGKGKLIGGLTMSGIEQGEAAAQAVIKIITTGKIPYFEVPNHGEMVFSQHELARWKISLPNHIQRRAVIIE